MSNIASILVDHLSHEMNTCRHVQKIRLSSNHSVLNSQKWKCINCDACENIWACLSCSHVACGKYLDEHIKLHYETHKHPLSMNVWEKYVYCYECDDYVLNDNAAGDIKILRSCLQAISSQKQHLCLSQVDQPSLPHGGDVLACRRSSRVQKSSTNSIVSMLQINPRSLLMDNNEEVAYTELWFRRYYLLAHFFNKWKMKSTNLQINSNSSDQEDLNEKKKSDSTYGKRLRSSSLDPPSKRRKHFIPGAVGLQNLGNTCYMNSILQVLKHLSQFSRVFLEEASINNPNNRSKLRQLNGCLDKKLEDKNSLTSILSPIDPHVSVESHSLPSPTISKESPSSSFHASPTTHCTTNIDANATEGFQETQMSSDLSPKLPSRSTTENLHATRSTKNRKKTPTKLSLSHELNSLLQIMWSGKMTLVSPHKMLYAVWNLIPFFRGYSQQDAQEFLSEFLDKVQSEMDVENIKNSANGLKQVQAPANADQERKSEQTMGEDIVTQLFQGELISQVKCLTCGYESNRREAFMDLSLEFPLRFHRKIGSNKSNGFCKLEEMLGQFMQTEKLEGKIYACEECNKASSKSELTVYSEAEKRFFISKLPNVLRLHLKRFMWSGRSSRGKITVNVAFPQQLNISEFCHSDIHSDNSIYSLSAVVMHHGRGFGSGHYTAYCWNNDADSWLHCNDAKMQKASLDDVQKAQAYILVYTKILPTLLDPQAVDSTSENGLNGISSKSMIPKFADATKRLRIENLGFYSIKRTKTTIW